MTGGSGHISNMTRRLAATVTCFLAAAICLSVPAQMKPADEMQLQKCWEYRYEGNAESRLAANGSTVFILRDASVVEAVAIDSGKRAWSSDVGGNVDSNLLAAGGSVIFVRRVTAGDVSRASVVALSETTGITRWSADVEGNESFTLGQNAGRVIAISRSGLVSSFGLGDGSRGILRRIGSGSIGEPILSDKYIYYVSDGVQVSSAAIASGGAAAIAKAPFAVTSLSVPFDDTIVWGDERGLLTSYSVKAGKIGWQFKSGAAISSIVRADGLILAASNDNFVYAIARVSGERIWKKRVSGRIQAMRPLGDDAVLIETVGERAVQVVYLKNGRTAAQLALSGEELPVTAASLPNARAAVLSDGALYMYASGGCSPK